jgi:probable HAF family extracellular repeat protein
MTRSILTVAAVSVVASTAFGGPSFQGLGDLPGGEFYSSAWDVSADGSVVVGYSYSASGWEAFRWTAGGGMVGLGWLPGGHLISRAYGVSADGSVVVGTNHLLTSGWLSQAFRWTQAGGMVGLGDLPGGANQSLANSVSADGSVVVGNGRSAVSMEPFRWTSGGGMVGLGRLPGGKSCLALGASADGSVVVGWGDSASGAFEAFIWDATNGMRSLHDVLVDDYGLDLTGWTVRRAQDASTDGSVLVGFGINPDGNTEAWIAVIPKHGDCDEDGDVDYDDFSALALSFGATGGWGDGDFDGDGVVGFDDFSALAFNFGYGTGTGAVDYPVGVPEPATAALLALGGLALVRPKRRH